jgi:hypothetical protein
MALTTLKDGLSHQRKSALTILLLLGLGALFFHPPLRAQTATTGATLSFPLTFTEKGSSLSTVINLGGQEVKFRKEPDFGKDRILRRALKVGPDKDDFIGIAADLTTRTLYLDLNQNLDLTDDPQGVYQGDKSSSSVLTLFRNVRLDLHKNGVDRSYLLDPFHFYGGGADYLAISSAYQGEIELDGRKWRLEVQDNLDGEINRRDRFSITRAASSHQAGGGAPTYSGMPVPISLFVDGHEYRLSFAFGTGPDVPPMTADLTEIRPPLGELVLDGRFIRRLVLEGAGLVVLDSPTRSVLLPVDRYRVRSVYIQPAPGRPVLAASDSAQIAGLSVTPGAPCHLKVGGPLESIVTTTARGNVLQLDYVLKGVGGEQYSLGNTDRVNPPKFAIYQGNHQLASGSFSFG